MDSSSLLVWSWNLLLEEGAEQVVFSNLGLRSRVDT